MNGKLRPGLRDAIKTGDVQSYSNNINFNDLSASAAEIHVTSSPILIPYMDGEITKSGYVFPGEQCEGGKDFLANHVA